MEENNKTNNTPSAKTNLRQLFCRPGTAGGVEIPMIQRDYAQGRTTELETQVRRRFLADIRQALTEGCGMNLDFVYGAGCGGADNSQERVDKFIPLDGQQRLTTLWLLYWLASRRQGVNPEECRFLERFSYATRPDTRMFCSKLAGYFPAKGKMGHPVSEHLRDQSWYKSGWDGDPSVDAMLLMLDAIDEVFFPETVTGIDGSKEGVLCDVWSRLDGITFYCMTVEQLGSTDQIYIRMNSRGKPLTQFEHFKAELDRVTGDTELTYRLDTAYTDFMWAMGRKQGEAVPDVDTRLMRFIRYVCSLISLKTIGKDIGRDISDFDLAGMIFRGNVANVDFLRSAFDALVEPDAWDVFSGTFGVADQTEWPLNTKKARKEGNLLAKLCGDSAFTYAESVLLYGQLVYLENLDKITGKQYRRRIRVLRNLVAQSSDELREERMGAILRETEALMLDQEIDTESNSFNQIQKEEEAMKLRWLESNEDNAAKEEKLAKYENHPLLLGSMETVGGVRGLRLYPTFCEVFGNLASDGYSELLTRGLLACGDIMQTEGYIKRVGGGTSFREGLGERWSRFLFPVSNTIERKNSGKAVRQLLQKFEALRKGCPKDAREDLLERICNDYLYSDPLPSKDWRYYAVKYPLITNWCDYGKWCWDDEYGWVIMTTEQRRSNYSYPLYSLAVAQGLENAGIQVEIFTDYSGDIKINSSDKLVLKCCSTEFWKATLTDRADANDPWEYELLGTVQQVSKGVDVADRVKRGVKLYKSLLPQ